MKEGEHDLRDKLIKELSPDGKQQVQVQHKWLWAISPLDSRTDVAFVAHCRSCNKTYTQRLSVLSNGANLGSVDLPEFGCKVPMGLVA